MSVPPSSIQGLIPAVWQPLIEGGLVVGGVLVTVLGYLRPAPKPAISSADEKAIASAMTAPLGDPNQLRLMAEGIARAATAVDHCVSLLDDIKDETARTTAAILRSQDRMEVALRAVENVLNLISRRP